MTTPVAQASIFSPQQTVYVDPWAVNPLLDDAEQAIPETVAYARAVGGDPPSMWDSGDLPPFTASGVDPQVVLTLLPWKMRHAAAMNASAATVLNWVEEYGHDSGIKMQSPGLGDYIARFRGWLAGKWVNPAFQGADPDTVAATENDLYDSLFGAQEDAINAKLAALNAANPPNPRTAAERAARAAQLLGRAVR